MTFFKRTEEEIVKSFIDKISQNTNISQLSPGSKMRFLLDTVAREQANQHQTFDDNLTQIFIRYADTKMLNFLGDMLNLPRRESTFAFAEEGNFIFYVSSGTFGDINGGLDITIPSGQSVTTVPFDGNVITPGLETQEVIEYITTEQVVCSASDSFVSVPIRASVEGISSIVPHGVLNKHSFSSYTLSSNNLLKCTNRYSIANGEDRESDEAYKFRLDNIFKAREMAIPMSIRLAALAVPGVSNISTVLCEQGTGSYSLYIDSTTPIASPQLLREVANIVYEVTGLGIRPFVFAAEPLGLELVCAVHWKPTATSELIAAGYRDIRNSIERRLNQLAIGEELDLEELVSVVLNASRYVSQIGLNTKNKFEEVYVYKRNQESDGVVRNLYLGDRIEPLYNEKIILETSGRHRGVQFITRQES